MNDIPNASRVFKFILYADDTNLFSTIEYTTHIYTSKADEWQNNEMSLVNEWLEINKLIGVSVAKFLLCALFGSVSLRNQIFLYVTLKSADIHR